MSSLKILKVLSVLLDYPSAELFASKQELLAVIDREAAVLGEQCGPLTQFIDELTSQPLIDAQENYVGLFDRGRRLSLLLFEHVHGESRDRGQAMVDLMNAYNDAGFYIDAKELPDYLPLFLEFLSQLPIDKAKGWLQEISHILALVASRLIERPSDYYQLFTALLAIADAEEDLVAVREQVRKEEADHTAQAMDKIWEEETVTFMANHNPDGGGCGSVAKSEHREAPVQWVDASHGNRHILPD